MEHIALRASTNLKLGSGFEVFTLILSTFILGQSRILVGRVCRQFLPRAILIALSDTVKMLPFDFTTSIQSTGIKTLMLVSLFRYLVLENVRSHRSRQLKIEEKPKQKIKEVVQLHQDSDDDLDTSGPIRPIEELVLMLKEGKQDLLRLVKASFFFQAL